MGLMAQLGQAVGGMLEDRAVRILCRKPWPVSSERTAALVDWPVSSRRFRRTGSVRS